MTPAPASQIAPISFTDTRVAFASKSDARLKKMYALFASMNSGGLVKTGSGLMKMALKWRLPGTKFLIKHSIFEQFCGGETIAECRPVVAELGQYNIGTILDYSVEGDGNDKSYDRTRDELLATIEEAHRTPHIPFSVFKVTGVADVAILEKIQSGTALTPAEQDAHNRAVARVEALCERAHRYGIRLFVDAEESWFQQTIDNLAYDMMAKYNRDTAIVWNTYQLYRHDRLEALQAAHETAVANGYHLGVKLVRGAYMEKEARVARQRGQQNPINPTKQATDDLYDESMRYCVQHADRISICAGTHNEASSLLLTQLMQEANLAPEDPRIWFAQLYGMSDNLTYNLAQRRLQHSQVPALRPGRSRDALLIASGRRKHRHRRPEQPGISADSEGNPAAARAQRLAAARWAGQPKSWVLKMPAGILVNSALNFIFLMTGRIRTHLIRYSRQQSGTMSYLTLVQEAELGFNLEISHEKSRLNEMLAEISTKEHAEGRPLLSCLIKVQGSKGQGTIFYKLCERLGMGEWRNFETRRRFFEESHPGMPGFLAQRREFSAIRP